MKDSSKINTVVGQSLKQSMKCCQRSCDLWNLNLKKEVTFTIGEPLEVGYVPLTYSFTKDQKPKTIADYFDFKDGKFVFKREGGFYQDFLVLMGLLEGGVKALEDHVNLCYYGGLRKPITLKTKPQYLNEEDREYLTDEQLQALVQSDVLAAVLKEVHQGNILEEEAKKWEIREITREMFPTASKENQDDIQFASRILKEHLHGKQIMVLQCLNGEVKFHVITSPRKLDKKLLVYVSKGNLMNINF